MSIYPDVTRLIMAPDELISYVDGMYGGIMENYESFRKAAEYPAPMFLAMPEKLPDNSVRFAWDTSYSYQQRPVTYNVRVYEDPHMRNLVFEQTDIVQTEYILESGLEQGTYYLKVTAIDDQGNEQLSMEHVEEDEMFVFGLLEFTIG